MHFLIHYLYCGISSLSSDHGGNSIIIRNAQSGFNAVCPNKEDVCCEKPLKINTNVTENCADDLDYHCVGIQVGEIHNFIQFKKIYYLIDYDMTLGLLFWDSERTNKRSP